jgi:hypothetical protein
MCRVHGGHAPAVRKRAAERVLIKREQHKIGELLRKYDVDDANPLHALLDGVRRTTAMLHVLEETLSDREVSNIGGDRSGYELVRMYGDWARLSAQISKMALDANIDERMLRANEVTTGLLFEVIERTIARVSMSDADARIFRQTLAVELRAVSPKRIEGPPSAVVVLDE